MVANDTIVILDDGEWSGPFADFCTSNKFEDREIKAIETALDCDGVFRDGGGALACFTLRLADEPEALRICRRWVAMCGAGFHPDTRGADYVPPLPKQMVAKYDADMERLFEISADPYAHGLAAMKERNLL